MTPAINRACTQKADARRDRGANTRRRARVGQAEDADEREDAAPETDQREGSEACSCAGGAPLEADDGAAHDRTQQPREHLAFLFERDDVEGGTDCGGRVRHDDEGP